MVKTAPPLQAGELHSSIERIAADLQRLDASLERTDVYHEEAAAQVTSLKVQVESHAKLLNANTLHLTSMDLRLAALEGKSDDHEQAFKGHLECINVLTADNEKLAVSVRDVTHRLQLLEPVTPHHKSVYRARAYSADLVERLSALERDVNDHLANLIEQSPDIDDHLNKKIQRLIKETQALDLRVNAQEDRLGPACVEVKDLNTRLTDVERRANGPINTRFATIRDLDSRLLLLEKDFAKADDSTKLKLQLLANTNDQIHVRITKLEDAAQPPVVQNPHDSERLDTVTDAIEAGLSETTKNIPASLESVNKACASVEIINPADTKTSDVRCEVMVAQANHRLRRSDLRTLGERASANAKYFDNGFEKLVHHVNTTNHSLVERLMALETSASPSSADINSLVEHIASTKDLVDHTIEALHQKLDGPLEKHSSRLKVLEETLSVVRKALDDLAPTHSAQLDLEGTITEHGAKLTQVTEDVDYQVRRLEALERAAYTSSERTASDLRDLKAEISHLTDEADRQKPLEDTVTTQIHATTAQVKLLNECVVSLNGKVEGLGKDFQALKIDAVVERIAALEDIIETSKTSNETCTQPVHKVVDTETPTGEKTIEISGGDNSSCSKSPRVLDLEIVNEDGTIKTGEDITILDAIATLFFHSARPDNPDRHKVSELTDLSIPAACYTVNTQCLSMSNGIHGIEPTGHFDFLRKGDIVEVTRKHPIFLPMLKLRFLLSSSGKLHPIRVTLGHRSYTELSIARFAEYSKLICRGLLATAKTDDVDYYFESGKSALDIEVT